MLEEIIGMKEKMLEGKGIKEKVLIIKKEKENERKGRVMLIKGEKELEERNKKKILGEGKIKRIVNELNDWKDEDRL